MTTAFDSVWHDGLLYKLLQIGVGGCFYKLIKNLYSNSSCTWKIGTIHTRSSSYSRGVRQGFTSTPMLFNLYVNDLPSAFQNTLSDSIILPNGTKLRAWYQIKIRAILKSRCHAISPNLLKIGK